MHFKRDATTENIIIINYGFTYQCYDCDRTIYKLNVLVERFEDNDLCLFDVDKPFLSFEIFPVYDSVKHVITNITMKRYNKFKELFDRIMCKRDKEYIKMMIECKMKCNLRARAYDFNKIVRTLLNQPEFELMD